MDETHGPGAAQTGSEGVLARLWDAWVGADSPDDGSAPAFVRTAEQVTGDEADDGNPGDGAGDEAGGGAGAAADGGPAAVQVFTADTVVSDQLDATGAVGNTSDGALSADGTYDVDWT